MQIAVNQDLYGADSVCEKQHWVLQDANYNVMGLVDSDGDLVERYEYSPYGERKVFVSAGTNDPGCYAPTLLSRRVKDSYASLDQPFGLCEFGHQGLPHEEEIDNGSMIQNRMRIRRGERWYQRDPLEYPDGMNTYAVYQVIHGGIDPEGLSINGPFKLGDKCYLHIYKGEFFWWPPFWGESYVGSVSYRCKDEFDHDIARHTARILEIEGELGNVAEAFRMAKTGCEVAIRLANDPLDNVLSMMDFIEDPSLRNLAGMAPFYPGAFNKVTKKLNKGEAVAAKGAPALDDLSKAAGATDKNGLTKAGRALQKHSDRPGSAFNNPGSKSPGSLNPAGQNVVDDILTTPGSQMKPNRLGGWDVVAPDGRGVRYNPDGSFYSLLEPLKK